MLAASYWSLLAPAIELANRSGIYGRYTFLPISLGFAAGAAFIYATDLLLPLLGVVVLEKREEEENRGGWARRRADSASSVEEGETGADYQYRSSTGSLRHRARDSPSPRPTGELEGHPTRKSSEMTSWRRILLLIIAITVHNIPEGLAVGVGFGAIGKTPSATLESARNLAIGIGIQNFPEGLAVSLPLRAAGMGVWKSLWYGQLSGMVEPLAGLFGTIAVVVAEPLLPYALSFAAGAMVYVVLDDLVPEANQCGNGKLSSVAAVFGFIVMMSLDVGLG
jgi:zinc transporter 11